MALNFIRFDLHNGGLNLGMGGHAKVIVGAPDSDGPVAPAELAGSRKLVGQAVDLLEDAVGVVHLLLQDLVLEELLVAEFSSF